MKKLRWLQEGVIAAAIFILCCIISIIIQKSPPERNIGKFSFTETPIDIQAIKIKPQDYQVAIQSYGQVQPIAVVTLQAQTSGYISEISENFYAGSFISSGETLIKINSVEQNHNLNLAQLNLDKSNLALQKYEETINQRIDELNLLKKNPKFADLIVDENGKSPSGIDKKSQYITLESELKRAKMEYKKASLELKNTKVDVPFDARIINTFINTTRLINKGEKLAEIIPIDAFEIRLPIKVFDQKYIDLPDMNPTDTNEPLATVRIINMLAESGFDTWPARLERTDAKLDEKNNMMHVVSRIEAPFSKQNEINTPLLIGQYVRAEISGILLKNKIMVPRDLIYDAQFVYIFKDQHIYKKEVELGWRDAQYVEITSGLTEGDLLITTQLGGIYSGTPANLVESEAVQ